MAATNARTAPRSERPRLLASNLKLRHLHGITIRNLLLDPEAKQSQGRANDDDALPHTLKSPTKLLSLDEKRSLTHSRSFDNLQSSLDGGPDEARDGTLTNGHALSPKKSTRRRARRRSTLDWTNVSPKQREARLQDALGRHMADVFFSLHIEGWDDPVYTSEVIENVMNPDFQSFDLASSAPNITRRSACVLRLWVKHDEDAHWTYLLKQTVNLSALQYTGKTLDAVQDPLPDNCILFHLQDGVYTLPSDDEPSKEPSAAPLPGADQLPEGVRANPTTTYDTLMRLSTLDQNIQEATATREKLTSQIGALIDSSHADHDGTLELNHFSAPLLLSSAKSSLATSQLYMGTLTSKTEKLRKSIAHLRNSLTTRRQAVFASRSSQTNQSKRTNTTLQPSLDTLESSSLKTTKPPIQAQRSRILSDLFSIYPIDPLPSHPQPLAFSIRNLYLPNSHFTGSDTPSDTLISAALGHVAHLVHLLSFYLSTPLSYPLSPHSSTSHIHDPISLIASSSTNPTERGRDRKFPLHLLRTHDSTTSSLSTSSFMTRFEYAVFLLNKDIEQLCAAQGLKILDVRQTLPNLKLLFLSVTGREAGLASDGRRTGGRVRGLEGAVDGERTDSVERSEVVGGAGKADGASGSLRRTLKEGTADRRGSEDAERAMHGRVQGLGRWMGR
ncbi:MAG: hypothetical protein M1828_005269 [Chrysothrix sp. TS-e1954]|nr:MAG: hypothetical protein M1828_005269 [Chrysothrix sp. TS-e1954]